MDIYIEENDIKDVIWDFIKFCDFIEKTMPLATKKGDLSTKSCYEVNQLLRHAKKNTKHTDRMYQYSSVSLWFYISKESGLIAYSEVNRGKIVFSTTDKYLKFKKMNHFSKYLLVFYTWFCFVDIEVQYNERGSHYILSDLIDRLFSQLSKHDTSQLIERVEGDSNIFGDQPVQILMEHYYKTAHDLMDLGLAVFSESNVLSKNYRCPILEKIQLTHLGLCVMKACRYRKYSWFNVYIENVVDIEEIEIYEEIIDSIKTGAETFFTPFLSCFPKDSIDISAVNAIIHEYEDNDKRMFEFIVSLNKRCYRTIRCLPHHTFEMLHLTIQNAFDFDNDHLYSFYLDGKTYSTYSVNSPYSENPPYADEVYLRDVRLRDKQKILYLFDYGDNWEFDIMLCVKTKTDETFENPEVIETVGDAPPQYTDYYE